MGGVLACKQPEVGEQIWLDSENGGGWGVGGGERLYNQKFTVFKCEYCYYMESFGKEGHNYEYDFFVGIILLSALVTGDLPMYTRLEKTQESLEITWLIYLPIHIYIYG